MEVGILEDGPEAEMHGGTTRALIVNEDFSGNTVGGQDTEVE